MATVMTMIMTMMVMLICEYEFFHPIGVWIRIRIVVRLPFFFFFLSMDGTVRVEGRWTRRRNGDHRRDFRNPNTKPATTSGYLTAVHRHRSVWAKTVVVVFTDSSSPSSSSSHFDRTVSIDCKLRRQDELVEVRYRGYYVCDNNIVVIVSRSIR